MKKMLLSILLTSMMLSGCINSSMNGDDDRPKTLPRSLTSQEEALIASGNEFSFSIFRDIVAAEQEKNIFISPLSISMALGMTLNGAEGETKAGIKETLNMSELELQSINQSYQSLIKLLVELDPKVEMNIGNSLWGDANFPILQSFKDTLQTYFGARVDELDFSDPASVNIINDWVGEQTNGRIEQIIEDQIPDDLVLYLINTIYFKGDWLTQFDPEETRPADFYMEDGSSVKVDMMTREETLTAAFSSDEVEMGELVYGDSLYKMTFLMPADRNMPIDTFVNESLTAANLAAWTGQLQSSELVVNLPKFESSYSKKLNEILIAMGMDKAFDEYRSNFSKINPNARLFISEVIHKANITVNEEGSEAAAATAVGVMPTSGPPSFTLNRPFVYMIRERVSGTILFTGVMRNPTQ